MAKRMLKYLDNSDAVKVGITELQNGWEFRKMRYFHSASCPASDERKRPCFRNFQALAEKKSYVMPVWPEKEALPP